MQASGNLAGALMDMFSQLVDKALGSQTVDKDGKPLREVCYMHLPMGIPIDPRDHSYLWRTSRTPAVSTRRRAVGPLAALRRASLRRRLGPRQAAEARPLLHRKRHPKPTRS
jgi:hypothetical protein